MRLIVAAIVIVMLALLVLALGARLTRAAARNVAAVTTIHTLQGGTSQVVCPELFFAGAQTPTVMAVSGDSRAWNMAGLDAYARGDFNEARHAFAQAPRDAVNLFWLGCAAWREGDKGSALAAWRGARAGNYFLNNGQGAYQSRDARRALSLYEIGLQLSPDSKEGWENLAEMQFDRAAGGQLPWNAAIEVFERQIELDPENAMAHYRIGYGLWTNRGDWERAETELRFAWARDKHWLIAYALGSLLVDRAKSAEAVGLLEYAFSKSDNAWTRFNLMRAYANVGRCAEAETAKTQALAKYPDILNPLRTWCRASAACGCESLP